MADACFKGNSRTSIATVLEWLALCHLSGLSCLEVMAVGEDDLSASLLRSARKHPDLCISERTQAIDLPPSKFILFLLPWEESRSAGRQTEVLIHWATLPDFSDIRLHEGRELAESPEAQER